MCGMNLLVHISIISSFSSLIVTDIFDYMNVTNTSKTSSLANQGVFIPSRMRLNFRLFLTRGICHLPEQHWTPPLWHIPHHNRALKLPIVCLATFTMIQSYKNIRLHTSTLGRSDMLLLYKKSSHPKLSIVISSRHSRCHRYDWMPPSSH